MFLVFINGLRLYSSFLSVKSDLELKEKHNNHRAHLFLDVVVVLKYFHHGRREFVVCDDRVKVLKILYRGTN